MRDTFVKTLCDISEKRDDIYLISGDLGFGVLAPYISSFPNRFINAGIAEQNMTGVAAGIALNGKTVFTYSIGNFSTIRCLEQIRNDCAYNNLNVKIICIGSGFTYGSLGMSHHATEDIGVMSSLPNITIFSPCDKFESEACTKAMCEITGTCYMRLGRGNNTLAHKGPISNFKIGQPLQIKSGGKIAFFFTGDIYDEVEAASDILKELKGIETSIYSFPILKPIDEGFIRSIIKQYDLIVTVEEHNIVNGLGSIIANVIAENKCFVDLMKIGILDTYCSVVGNQKYLRKEYGIDSETIYKKVALFLEGAMSK